MSLRPVVLTIAGSDAGGGAGIQADLATFLALGVHGTTALTALTAQSGTGISGIHQVPPAFVAAQIRTVCAGFEVAAAKTGMLSSAGTVRAVAGAIREAGLTNLVVDPVIRSTSGTPLLDPAGVGTLLDDLLALTTVLTPNLDEAAAMTGTAVEDLAGMRTAAGTLRDRGATWVLVKGGHLPGRAVDVLAGPDGIAELDAERLGAATTHGTGCVLSAAIAAYLARGAPVPDAVALAKEHVTGAIRTGVLTGSGRGNADGAWNIRPDQQTPFPCARGETTSTL